MQEVGGDETRFEELPEQRRSPGRRALLIAAAVAVGVAVIVGIVARIVTSGSPSPRANVTTTVPPSGTASSAAESAGPTSNAPRPLTTPPPDLTYLSRLTRAELARAHERCPRLAPTCTTTGETPIAVSEAIRDALPGAAHFVAVSDIAYSQISATTTSGPMLAYRRLSARTASVRVSVEVRQAEDQDGDGGISFLRGGVSVVREQRVIGTRVIEVQASAARAMALDTARLRRLSGDVRLLATG